jgi:hypothetical protein
VQQIAPEFHIAMQQALAREKSLASRRPAVPAPDRRAYIRQMLTAPLTP